MLRSFNSSLALRWIWIVCVGSGVTKYTPLLASLWDAEVGTAEARVKCRVLEARHVYHACTSIQSYLGRVATQVLFVCSQRLIPL